MRANWNRVAATVELALEELTVLIQPKFPGQSVIESQLAEGGLTNTNICMRLSGQDAPVLLRLFVRKPTQARMEYNLNRLISSRAPTARFLYFADDNPITAQPYALLEWIDGVRLETIVLTAPPNELIAIGRAVGTALACIHAVTFANAGFFDVDLNIVEPINVGCAGLQSYLHKCLIEGWGAERLGMELTRRLMSFVEAEGGLLDKWNGSPCLVHGDFGGSNILIRQTAKGWETGAVLDWEFAFSGSPFFDFGNLLRPPLGASVEFEQAVVEGYKEAGGQLPDEWKRMSRLTDLTAWADFLNRPDPGQSLISDARAMIRRTLTNCYDCSWHTQSKS